MSTSGAPLISLRDVTKTFPHDPAAVIALDGIHLDVQPGSFVGLVGPAGAGKSTLLQLLEGVEAPTSGQLSIAGHDLSDASPRTRSSVGRRLVASVAHHLFPHLTAWENVRFAAGTTEVGDAAIRADRALSAVGLSRHGREVPERLTEAQRRRLAIARAIATGNPVIVADEPAVGLDDHERHHIVGLLASHARRGATVLMACRDDSVDALASVADRVIALSDGRIVADEARGAR
ncbi:MAG: ATP-binding cassette domain-containing protein [Acidimicrobiales bacterium]|nr:ATP-binding cassette domain-containing protein [Acidimicrobiales bacterium]MCB9396071.1 ATP-binding cassette domain-containing protein [Acidimicrobiaceae bacterium]